VPHAVLIRGFLVVALSAASAVHAAPQASSEAQTWDEVAASGANVSISWAEFDALLVARYAMSEDGRAALKQLMRARLLDRLARESRLEVGPAEVDARWAQIDSEARAKGETGGLPAFLEAEKVDPLIFREFLRLAIVQETLARRALGLPEGRSVPPDQQEMWLDQVIEQRGTQMPPPPWDDGVAARCGDLTLSVRDYTQFLRTQLAPELVRDACYQMLLARRVRERLPDLASEALDAAVEAEIARRQAEVAQDPKYKGLSYEQILSAQGMRLDTLRKDPAVITAALAQVWVDRSHGEEGLREVYAKERAWFDGRFGEVREVRALFLRGAVLENKLNPRSIEEAERELMQLDARMAGLEDFEKLVLEHSEDAVSRDKQGLLGWLPRGDERVPAAIRDAAFSDRGRPLGNGRLVGPLRLTGGAALLWIGASRPAPGWEVMRVEVHRELRRRFLEECLPRETVVTYLDN
jgi:parvulin-like peptidyl-prolyl isomerase